jgi:hypothetical protein
MAAGRQLRSRSLAVLASLSFALLSCNYAQIKLFPFLESLTMKPEPTGEGEEGSISTELKEHCVVPGDEYAWAFQNMTQETGSRGTKCEVTFTFNNRSGERVLLHVYREIHDGKSLSGSWDSYPVAPLGMYTVSSSKTTYEDGGETFDRIKRILVTLDESKCSPLHLSSNPGVEEDLQKHIHVLTNPCE